MTVSKLSISLDSDLADAVRDAARRNDQNLSAWLAGAAASRLRREGLREFLDAWEDEHGHFSADEIEQARAELRSAIEGVAR